MDDKELIRLFKSSGDLTLLGELYQRYMDLVYGVCLKYYKEPEKAKDSVMLIFEELISKLKKHEVDNFRGWLYQLAKNHCLMELRKPQYLKTVELRHDIMQSAENLHLNGEMDNEENIKKLTTCLETLEKEQKSAIKLFYLEGKCYNEIVEITGYEWNMVRSYIQNGRRKLKLCMEKAEKEIKK
jgi:RNA polymerase sigma-70 factor (ECF subfamily)